MSETITIQAEIQKAVRYVYPAEAIPVKQFEDFDFESKFNLEDVPQASGAVGFDFVRIVYFELDSRTLRHVVAEAETYFWGTELSDEDLEAAGIRRSRHTDRYVLNSSGAVIPLRDHEFVVSPKIHVE